MSDLKLVRVRRVRALANHRLEMTFDDGTSGVIDLSEFVRLGPMTAPLQDPTFFSRVFIEMGVPTWPNGCDIDPINAQMLMRAASALSPTSVTA